MNLHLNIQIRTFLLYASKQFHVKMPCVNRLYDRVIEQQIKKKVLTKRTLGIAKVLFQAFLKIFLSLKLEH